MQCHDIGQWELIKGGTVTKRATVFPERNPHEFQ